MYSHLHLFHYLFVPFFFLNLEAANPSECRIAGLGETVDYQTRDIVKCPQNTYKDTKSYHVDSCIPCPVNRPLTAGEGSTTIEDCKELACPKDQYVVDGQCVHCPANSVTMGEGSKTIDECVAPKGYYMNAENNVLPCPVDTYKEEVGNSECVPCTEGYVKSTYHKTACTSKDDCLIKSHAEGLAQKIATKRDIMKKIQLMTKFVKLYGFNPNL